MDDFEDLPSDSSDEDYVPGKASSDEECSEPEDEKIDSNDESDDGENEKAKAGSTKSKKRKQKRNDVKAHKRKGGIRLDDDDVADKDDDDHIDSNFAEAKEVLGTEKCQDDSEEKQKERANDLWSSFLKDVDVKSKSKMAKSESTTLAENSSSAKNSSRAVNTSSNKVVVTKVYDFAGEEVRVNEEVDVNSKAARIAQQHLNTNTPTSETRASVAAPASCVKKSAGLSGVLSRIGGKKKMSTLEKSRLDWMEFKVEEGIDEELKVFNKGKHGYLEKQAFIQRTDERQFEIERSLRLANQSHR